MLGALVFLTPTAALVGFVVLIPLAAFVLAERRLAVVRRVLMLQPPRGGVDAAAIALPVTVVLLLALAAAQPALSNTKAQRVRTDAEVLFVVDISRSMAASSSRGGSRRLDRARSAVLRLRASIPSVPAMLSWRACWRASNDRGY